MNTALSTRPFSDHQLEATTIRAAGQLMASSRALYTRDARYFDRWLSEASLTLQTVDRDAMVAYRAHLGTTFANTTANRMLTVARRILEEAKDRKIIPTNPGERIDGFTVNADETPHTALTKEEAVSMLGGIPRTSLIGLRDYALVYLLLRTGIRCAECAALSLEDIKRDGAHYVAKIKHGKGDKPRTVKLAPEVLAALGAYLAATGRTNAPPRSPLFVRIRKGNKVTDDALSHQALFEIVRKYAPVGVHLSPHGLRATFVTLALEGGAALHKVQYAAGHADPRTTERYQRRKLNLDDNAVDYLTL